MATAGKWLKCHDSGTKYYFGSSNEWITGREGFLNLSKILSSDEKYAEYVQCVRWESSRRFLMKETQEIQNELRDIIEVICGERDRYTEELFTDLTAIFRGQHKVFVNRLTNYGRYRRYKTVLKNVGANIECRAEMFGPALMKKLRYLECNAASPCVSSERGFVPALIKPQLVTAIRHWCSKLACKMIELAIGQYRIACEQLRKLYPCSI
eukprot:scpid100180/ scgid23420/ 